MSIFRLYELLVFIAQKAVFSLQNIIQHIFVAYTPLKKKLEKWLILQQSHGQNPLEKCQFFDFLNFLFLKPRKLFFVLEYYRTHFPGLYCLKKRWEMVDFTAKPWTKPFGKMSIFRLFELLVFKAQKVVFLFQNIIEHIFLAYTALKKKVGKMVDFTANPWTKPFGKMSIFRRFELLVFYSLESCFFFLEYYTTHFQGLYSLKKKLEKWLILQQSHGLNPLKHCQIFDFLNFLFLQPRKLLFRSRILYNTFSFPILP